MPFSGPVLFSPAYFSYTNNRLNLRLFKNQNMALIGTLRNKMGTWVVVFVFVAITAFIVGDLFSGNSSILNWGQKSVGEIGGREISIDEFQSAIRERENNYA